MRSESSISSRRTPPRNLATTPAASSTPPSSLALTNFTGMFLSSCGTTTSTQTSGRTARTSPHSLTVCPPLSCAGIFLAGLLVVRLSKTSCSSSGITRGPVAIFQPAPAKLRCSLRRRLQATSPRYLHSSTTPALPERVAPPEFPAASWLLLHDLHLKATLFPPRIWILPSQSWSPARYIQRRLEGSHRPASVRP